MLILILAGCAIVPGLKEGDASYSTGDKRAALAFYEEALPKVKNAKLRAELTLKIQNIRKEFTDSALGETVKLRKEGETIPVLTKVVALLNDNLKFDDAEKRLTKTQQESSASLEKMTKDYAEQMETISRGETTKDWTKVVLAYQRARAEARRRVGSAIGGMDRETRRHGVHRH